MLNQPITAVPWAIVDVETTGLWSDSGDRVCEVAVGLAEPNGELEVWSSLVNPGRPIDPDASAVNGISDADVRDAPPFSALIADFDERLRDRLLIAHNAEFDVGFLTAEYAIARRAQPDVHVVDTLYLARRQFRFRSNNLGSVALQLDLPAVGLHRAGGDVEVTFNVFRRMVEVLADKGIVTVGEFLQAQGITVSFEPARTHALPEPLERALGSDLSVTICYTDAGGRTSERSVKPLWVNHTYLIAYCRLMKAQRTFRLDRIEDAWLS